MKDFWKRHTIKKDIPDLATLINILIHLHITNSVVEASFSIQKHIQRDERERLSITHVNEEMKIKWSQIVEDKQLKKRKREERDERKSKK